MKYCIIPKKEAERLEIIGINLNGAGCHHFVPKTLSSQAKQYMKNGCDKPMIKKLNNIFLEMDFDLVISMPNFPHQNHNKVFAGDFTPEEVLKKLDWILDEKREFAKGRKEDIIDMFSIVSVFSNQDDGYQLDLEKVLKLKESDGMIIPNNLLEDFNIKKENIVKYLENFFFYPEYDNYRKHFELLSSLRTSDRVRKTRVQIYMKYKSM